MNQQSIEGQSGQTPTIEQWTTPDDRTLVVHYDERGITEVTREALTELLLAAGLAPTTHAAPPEEMTA